ncbi:TetR/AcrR family transcriptional regulator [Paractinoplanes bogorensis]|uniref:TetR/AcrR family transcriptional regulator n=1 Tax=Paractinoplanes bogorensis TaxID=1610840 RepID=UPI0027E1B76A|nr:TetR/AcrR family transcriptional regulator [Actinoplanes bogorensis]
MTTAPLRKDAARNWQRILDVGRRLVDDEAPIQLNEVARSAEVGVATVYRHFPTPEALVETIATPGLEALADRPPTGDPWEALRDFLHAAIEAQTSDPAIATTLAAPHDALPHTTELKQRLHARFAELLDRAHKAGVIDPAVTAADIAPLMCGVAFAAKVHPGDRAATARRYLDILFDGLRSRVS